MGNVYAWAGEYRTLNIGKAEFQFAATGQIPRLMGVLDSDYLYYYTPCCNMTDEQLAAAIAKVHVELILIHPFREGNGRMSRALANVMAMQAGKAELDYSIWGNQKAHYFSAIQAGLDNYQPMIDQVMQVLHEAGKHEDQ